MRKHYKNISKFQRVDRSDYVDQIVEIIKAVYASTQKMKSDKAVDSEEHRKRFILLKAGAGVGKTVLLQQLQAELLEILRREDCVSVVTKIINLQKIIDNPNYSKRVMSIYCNEKLSASDVFEQSVKITDMLKEHIKPVVILLDDLETLNNPLIGTSNERDERVKGIKNLFLRPLLELWNVPVIIIAAARAMPDEPMQYLSEIEFQDALIEIPIENRDEDVQRVLGEVSTSDKIEECAGCLLVADALSNSKGKTKLSKTLIDEIMGRDYPLHMDLFRCLLTKLNKFQVSGFDIEVIKSKAKECIEESKSSISVNRIPARLIAAAYIHAPAIQKYYIYKPLANLLK